MPETGNNITEATINLIDETFDISQSGSYYLSVQIETDGLSFCIFNTIINKYIVLRHYPYVAAGNDETLIHQCRNIFENDDLLKLSYKGCGHLWISPRCTLVPEHLFDAENAGPYLNFNHGWKANEQVLQNYVRLAKLRNVFSCPNTLMTLLFQYQPATAFFHHATPFVDLVVADSLSTAKPRIALYYYDRYMDIGIAQAKKALFYNTFQVNSPEDSIYYLAGVLNLFDIPLASTRLFYAGNSKDYLSHIEFLKKYIDRAIECEPFDMVTYSHYLTDSLRKRFIHLFNLYGCVS